MLTLSRRAVSFLSSSMRRGVNEGEQWAAVAEAGSGTVHVGNSSRRIHDLVTC